VRVNLGLSALPCAVFVACVGSEPLPPAPVGPDAGRSSTPGDGGPPGPGSGNDGGGSERDGGGLPPPCNLDAPFDPPTPFNPINTNDDDADLRFSADGALAYFVRGSFTGNISDVLVAAKADGFNGAIGVVGANSPSGCCADAAPSVTPDGLEIVFYTNDATATLPGGPRVWHATRSSKTLAFTNREPIAALSALSAHVPILSHDGQAIYFTDLGTKQIKRSGRIDAQFGGAVPIVSNASFAAVTGDERTLYFDRGGKTMVATQSLAGEWTTGKEVPELAGMTPSWVSADGCTIALASGKMDPAGKAGANAWTATKPK
jgi:hypothetical protein